MTHPLQALFLTTSTPSDPVTPTIFITLHSDTYLTMVRWKQDNTALTHFSFDAFLQWSPAERNSFSLTVKCGWTASFHTIALNLVLSDGLIKTQYLFCIFVMTFTDVLHCSGRLVISIKTDIEQLESIYQQISESLNYFLFLLHQKTVGSVFAHVLSFVRKTRWNKFFFVPVLVYFGTYYLL